MKNTKKTKLVMAALMTMLGAGSIAQAQDYGTRNGGDVLEKRFNNIADDLREWILKGGAQRLVLPEGILQSDYEQSMLAAISGSSVSFTKDKILVNGVEKDCQNIPSAKEILCNADRFKGANEQDQYVIVHHEFAGVAGLETNDGKPQSNYFFSNQITSSLEKQMILKLAVKKPIYHYQFDHLTIYNVSNKNFRMEMSCNDEKCLSITLRLFKLDSMILEVRKTQEELAIAAGKDPKVITVDPQEGSVPGIYEMTGNVAKNVKKDFNDGYYVRGSARGLLAGLSFLADTIISPVTGFATLTRVRVVGKNEQSSARAALGHIQEASTGTLEISLREKQFSKLYPLFD